MMIDLGILSLFQMTFLPGLIVTRWLKVPGLATNLLLAFPLSPILNFLLVFLATSLGIYTRTTVFLLVLIELVLLIYLYRSIFNIKVGDLSAAAPPIIAEGKISLRTILTILLGLLAIYQLARTLVIYSTQVNTIFTEWDAVVSWDRWAVDWYHNQLPHLTWHYPQVIPVSWSLGYQILGDDRVKFFAKDLMYFFEVFPLLVLSHLALVRKQTGTLAGVFLTGWLLLSLGSHGSGLVDTAAACLGLAALAVLYQSETLQEETRDKYILLGAALAAGSALIKQAGLWILLIYPLLYIGYIEKGFSKRVFRNLLLILLILVGLAGPWYGYKEYQIRIGADQSEIADTTGRLHEGQTPLERLQYSAELLEYGLGVGVNLPPERVNPVVSGTIVLGLLGLLMLLGMRQAFGRWLVLTGVLPFSIIWALLFGYDTRNIALILPLLGWVAGMGIGEILLWIPDFKFPFPALHPITPDQHRIPDGIDRIRSFRPAYGLLLLLPWLILLPFKYTDSQLIQRALDRQKQLGDPVLDAAVYKYQVNKGFKGKILTDYLILPFLPGLDSYYVMGHTFQPQFIQMLDNPAVAYALVSESYMNGEVRTYIQKQIDEGNFHLLFKVDSWWFVSTCQGACPG